MDKVEILWNIGRLDKKLDKNWKIKRNDFKQWYRGRNIWAMLNK